MRHPLETFEYCPVCGQRTFMPTNEKASRCASCGFVYYFNPSAAVACFIKNTKGELMIVRRGQAPAENTLDLPGGFVDMFETGEDAVRREVKEETNLDISACRYLFSIPNIYPYSGFKVHTLDLFFECEVQDFMGAVANDDAEEICIVRREELNPEDFGLESVRKAVSLYLAAY
ncbi:NUDIX domain-containing protein [Parabacteroides sp. 52]|uniref:NUDIX hydrolase n=1 Tax=unclassified Parabacteroides TaxID=2649774 RepID=UPI0013D25E1A|nr:MULTISPECIES: NUDIX domain-containing protein [unclassified Parabacteroides]MDH6535122.1 NAD+ diphosphatase [Parabacteroides sp. PM5-20]NDV55478.1 NUDIX domain-containing protein [Parabacteroides sp. 52]